MAKLLVLNGPNLNLLGQRETKHYGNTTLADIQRKLDLIAPSLGHDLIFKQSNAEHELVGQVQQALADKVDFIIINPAAFTHTSIALRDAFLAVNIPFIEVHLSNIHARDSFRQHSYLNDIAIGSLCGLGAFGYELALLAADQYLQQDSSSPNGGLEKSNNTYSKR